MATSYYLLHIAEPCWTGVNKFDNQIQSVELRCSDFVSQWEEGWCRTTASSANSVGYNEEGHGSKTPRKHKRIFILTCGKTNYCASLNILTLMIPIRWPDISHERYYIVLTEHFISSDLCSRSFPTPIASKFTHLPCMVSNGQWTFLLHMENRLLLFEASYGISCVLPAVSTIWCVFIRSISRASRVIGDVCNRMYWWQWVYFTADFWLAI